MSYFREFIVAVFVLSPAVLLCQQMNETQDLRGALPIVLPAPHHDSQCSIEKALATRKSVRAFKGEALRIATISQLVWAAQGITRKMDAPAGWHWGTWQGGRRTAPSAGALYPLELYAVVGNVDGLKPAVYKYKPQTHELWIVTAGDKRGTLAAAALGQKWMENAPCVFVVSAVYKRTEVKYEERAPRSVHIEVGHAVENICLQAVALDLGTTMVGAFNDDEVKAVVGMSGEEQPLAIVPVGKGGS
ncbi:MAG TPA: SagB/ThcOx family dehydrogenase [Bacteroidota bacterium]|nr:SagB/ThcOx family dehydrogenase [Bacteroidota bacterium]